MQRACALALLQRSAWYAKSHARDQSALRQRIRDIALSRPRFGYRRVLVMLQREGWNVGKKRVYRLYSLEGLQLRMKVKRRKRIALLRGKPPVATGPNQHWSMDFAQDQILDGRSVRILTVIDQWSRESVCLEANFRQTGRGVGQALTGRRSSAACPTRSPSITERNLRLGRWTTGHTDAASNSTTHAQGSRRIMGSSSRSTVDCVMNSLMCMNSSRWTTCSKNCELGRTTTTTIVATAHSVI